MALGLSSALDKSLLWGVFVRGWRPACGWACGAILLVRGVAEPIVALAQGRVAAPIDWLALTGFAALLIAARSYDKSKGTA